MGRRRTKEDELLARSIRAGMDVGREQGILSVLTRIARRLFRLDARDAARMIEERGTADGIQALGQLAKDVWAGRWEDALSPVIEEIMDTAPMPTDRGNAVLSFDLKNDKLKDYFDGYIVELAGQITETTRENITDSVREGLDKGESVPEIASRVKAHSDDISPARANLIARTESIRASNGASLIKAKESGVVKGKKWLATNDSRTRPEHRVLDGTVVGIDEPFPNGLQHPGEPNCRCSTTFVIDFDALGGGS